MNNKKILLGTLIFFMTLILFACDNISNSKDNYELILERLEIIYDGDDTSDRITKNISLPTYVDTSIKYDSIAWTTSMPQVINANGVVTRQVEDVEVLLAVTVVIEGVSKEKIFIVNVYGLKNEENFTWDIVFDTNGGTTIVPQTVSNLGTVTKPKDPEKENNIFLGWYLNDEPYDFETIVTSDLIIVAKWFLDEDLHSRKLLFNDEFNGNSLDLTKWDFQNGTGREYGLWWWGNNERQIYQPDNVEVSKGTLKIHAKIEPTYDPSTNTTMKYTSSKIVTLGSHSQTYGRIEARIKAPVGQGFWPAFWMMPVNNTYGIGWPHNGEIDIMELRGRKPQEVTSAFHYQAKYGDWQGHQYQTGNTKLPEGQSIADFHVYGVEWSQGRFEFFVDDDIYHVRTYNDWRNDLAGPYRPFDHDFFIIINLAIGGMFDGDRLPEDELFPAYLEVDYVRAYAPL